MGEGFQRFWIFDGPCVIKPLLILLGHDFCAHRHGGVRAAFGDSARSSAHVLAADLGRGGFRGCAFNDLDLVAGGARREQGGLGFNGGDGDRRGIGIGGYLGLIASRAGREQRLGGEPADSERDDGRSKEDFGIHIFLSFCLGHRFIALPYPYYPNNERSTQNILTLSA